MRDFRDFCGASVESSNAGCVAGNVWTFWGMRVEFDRLIDSIFRGWQRIRRGQSWSQVAQFELLPLIELP
jgi:hypothetical protein